MFLVLCLQPDNDISAYTYERTLMMEQRTEIMKELHLKRRDKAASVSDLDCLEL